MSFQVLLYHGLYRGSREIRGSPEGAQVSLDEFSRQIRWLKETGHTLLSLARCREMAEAGALPPRTVCITFDDGKKSDGSLAAPVLLREGAGATFFIVPAWISHPVSMTAAEIRELASLDGMEIGSHSMSHPFLTEAPDEDLRSEVGGSRKFLEDLLGRRVECFSYPYGDCDGRVAAAVERAGYRMGCGTRRGRNPDSPDWLRLKRWGVPGGIGAEGVGRLVARRTPSWGQAAGEVMKRMVGLPRFVRWKERWERRAGE